MNARLQEFVIFFPIFLFSLSFHEMAHAWMANRCGDDTARLQGRLTLNPLVHIDFLGTVVLPMLVFFTSLAIPLGGWAKPVPVNDLRLKKWRVDMMKVSSAGPISNLILALLSSALLYGLFYLPLSPFPGFAYVVGALQISIYLNLGLAFFNLIPLHPLDGGKVVENFIPSAWREAYNTFAQYGIWILLMGYYVGLFKLVAIPVRFFAGYLIPSSI